MRLHWLRYLEHISVGPGHAQISWFKLIVACRELHNICCVQLVPLCGRIVSQAFHNGQAPYQGETLDKIPRPLNNAMTSETGDRSHPSLPLPSVRHDQRSAGHRRY